jgi:pimeloyl-ACP methyl ester carboxylesterase
MSVVWAIMGWVFAILFGLLTVSMLLMRNWAQTVVALLLTLLFLPPVASFLQNSFGFSIHPLLRGMLIVGLLAVFAWLMAGRQAISIYASPEVKERFMAIYDEKMQGWPVPFEDVFLDTEYGTVHIIVSGPEDAPPLLLLHASGVAGWSWKYNAAGLSEHYRTYAIDLIGDAGKSEFRSLDYIMKTGEDQARLYTEITDKLGVETAYVVGASEGGFIGSNYAIYASERVEKLVLLGPMGYAGATQSIIRITLAQLFPLRSIQDGTFHWAFSNSDILGEELGEWFHLFMSETTPKKVAPLPLSAEERQRLQVPVLFVFGERDNLVGDPHKARDLVRDIPDVQVEIVDAGHLMAAELPDQVNDLIRAFFASE